MLSHKRVKLEHQHLYLRSIKKKKKAVKRCLTKQAHSNKRIFEKLLFFSEMRQYTSSTP